MNRWKIHFIIRYNLVKLCKKNPDHSPKTTAGPKLNKKAVELNICHVR